MGFWTSVLFPLTVLSAIALALLVAGILLGVPALLIGGVVLVILLLVAVWLLSRKH